MIFKYIYTSVYSNLRKKFCLKTVVFLFIFAHSTAQDNQLFEHFNINDGLSNNSINSLLQTRDGFLWIATKDGLNRFDGQSFRTFKNVPADSSSLPENYVMSLLEDTQGSLWVGTWGGSLCKFDRFFENFISFDLDGAHDDYIQCIFESSDSTIWYGTATGGLYKLSSKNLEITSYTPGAETEHSIPAINITSIAEDRSGNLWIGTWEMGLFCYDTKTGNYKQFRHNLLAENSLSDDGVWDIFNEENKTLWLSTFSGIDKLDLNNGVISPYPIEKDNIQSIFRQTIIDSKNRIWVGTYNYHGLFLIEENPRGGVDTYQFVNEDFNPQSLSIDRIRWIYEDMKENIWIGTENGLNKLPSTLAFKQNRYFPIRETSLNGKIVSGIFEGRNRILWVGYGGAGFDRINLKNNNIRHFSRQDGVRNSLSDNDVVSIYEDKRGIVWICTMNGGLNSFNPVTGDFVNYSPLNKDTLSIGSEWVHQVLETSNGLFLAGTNHGLDVLDTITNNFKSFKPAYKNTNVIFPPHLQVNALYEDSRANIWIGTWLDGVFLYNSAGESLRQFIPEENNPNSLSSNKITSFLEDSNHNIWIGTHSGGVNVYHPKEDSISHLNTRNGLPNDVVFGIQEDNNGNIWISTMKGLVKYNPEDQNFRIYDVADGIIDNQFNWHASFKNKKGKMYFGGINGFISFHPDSISKDTIPPLISLTSFRVFNEEAKLPQSISTTKVIKLKHNQNFFSIGFRALDMAPGHKHNYAYFLEGIDPNWVYSGTTNTASYTDIRPGTFDFLIKASNADDVWSEPIKLTISILPAWWMTWWIKILGSVSLGLILFLIIRIRYLHLIEIERIRLSISRDLHDHMGSNLSAIRVDSRILMKSKNMNPEELELASDIYKTTGETVDSIRDIIWFINPKNDENENIILKMRETASKLLAGLDYSFVASPEIRLNVFDLDIRRNIFLIYKESLNNVVRHSDASHCRIELKKENNFLHLTIADNGKGFDTNITPKNSGLHNIYYRAEKIRAPLTIESKQGKGTIILLKIPLKNLLKPKPE
ncbi:MAG: hypothetical protein K9H49_04220 [Bacteroidales bacterium]|nr:hypothetical protein [Bacteroidales bacterium]MCF8390033.1 hypothetical protein [Bacteroidales bacterium]